MVNGPGLLVRGYIITRDMVTLRPVTQLRSSHVVRHGEKTISIWPDLARFSQIGSPKLEIQACLQFGFSLF